MQGKALKNRLDKRFAVMETHEKKRKKYEHIVPQNYGLHDLVDTRPIFLKTLLCSHLYPWFLWYLLELVEPSIPAPSYSQQKYTMPREVLLKIRLK